MKRTCCSRSTPIQGAEHVELAAVLGLDPGKARDVLHDIMATGYPGWLDEHDTIVTFYPLSKPPLRDEVC